MTALLNPISTTPIPAPSGPRPFVWTVPLFHQLGDLGVFEGRRAKLIDGSLLEEGPMNPPHGLAIELTEESLRAAFGAGWRLRVQMPLVLSQRTDPLPDLAVIRGTARGITTHPTTAELVVEVADSSLDFDTTAKAELYATAGIADYWVLDVDGRRLLVFRDPEALPAGLGATAYRTRFILTPTDTISPLAVPTASVRVSDLLP